MLQNKKGHPKIKPQLHPRSKHRERYDFDALIKACPELAPFIILNKFGDESINFFDAEAVKLLNRALLGFHYGIKYWDIPDNYLCPPIPGRADYIHYIADLVSAEKQIPKNAEIKCLDIGVGANCVYPIIGTKEYGWSFVGSDIDPVSIESANKIVAANPLLAENVECRLQNDSKDIFHSIIKKEEHFDLTICNPPFHASLREAQAGNIRKQNNIHKKRNSKPALNFGGQSNELWCKGGEEAFIRNMIRQSKYFATSCLWFTTIISKHTTLPSIYRAINKSGAAAIETISMEQGNKKGRVVAWTFLSEAEQKIWKEARW